MAWFDDHNLAPLIQGKKTRHYETITIPREETGQPPLWVIVKVETNEEWKTGLTLTAGQTLFNIWASQGYQVALEPIGGGGWKVTRFSETRSI